eukprot:15397086-Heterocapsa_arctica.AAC.1
MGEEGRGEGQNRRAGAASCAHNRNPRPAYLVQVVAMQRLTILVLAAVVAGAQGLKVVQEPA